MISETTISKYKNLQQIIESGGQLDARRAESLINDLKLAFLTLNPDNSPDDARVMHRDVLELDALYSIRTKNLDEFERAMAQLKCYYFREMSLPISPRMPLLLAIHLVSILGQKEKNKTKLVNFNIELQLARDLIGHNQFIDYAAALHQSVNDNSFAKLFELENSPPSPLFNQFTADLLNGARNNHADSIERAYTNLTLDELSSILHFSDKNEARQFAAKRNWVLAPDQEIVVFNQLDENKTRASDDMLSRAVDLSVQISLLA